MKCSVNIKSIKTVNELPNAWSSNDYVELLKRMNFPDAEKTAKEDLLDFLFMAINDFEPTEAAEVILEYKLSNKLNKGQIHQLSNEMPYDKVAEDYSDISLHEILFNINQLLYKAYNGRFPNTEASIIDLELKLPKNEQDQVTNEIIIKALNNGLNERNIIKRLFDDQINGEKEFPEAESILWKVIDSGDQTYTITTSKYWLDKDDFSSFEFEGTIKEFEVEQEED